MQPAAEWKLERMLLDSSTVLFSLAVLHIITYKTPDATQKHLAFPVTLSTLPKAENFEKSESGFILRCAKGQKPLPQIACKSVFKKICDEREKSTLLSLFAR